MVRVTLEFWVLGVGREPYIYIAARLSLRPKVWVGGRLTRRLAYTRYRWKQASRAG